MPASYIGFVSTMSQKSSISFIDQYVLLIINAVWWGCGDMLSIPRAIFSTLKGMLSGPHPSPLAIMCRVDVTISPYTHIKV